MPAKVRIVRIFSRLNVGGPSIHVILLTAKLDPNRFESRLLIGKEGAREGNMFDQAAAWGVQPVVIPSLGREISPWNDLKTIFALWRYMRAYRPHIVHTHTSKAGFVGRIAAGLARVPIVIHTFHGHVFEGYFKAAPATFIVLLERFLARRSDKIIAISEHLRDDLTARKVAPREKLEVVPLGLDLSPFLAVRGRSNVLRGRMNMGPDESLVGIVGRLVAIKDHATFLRAAASAAKIRGNLKFAIIGDGELRADIEALANKLGLEGRVYFAGWVKDLAPIYADLDLVVLSSRSEGTPVSIIEGSAAGKPVVATCVGGVPDMIKDKWNGFLVPPGDPMALADSMLAILADPALSSTFAQRSREKITNFYSVDRLVADLESLYGRLLSAKGISILGISRSADAMTGF